MVSGIVFDEDEGVAEVAEIFERAIEEFIVVGMEADGRLIEDVEAGGEARAELAGEADPLQFAAAESGRRALSER